MKHGQLIAGIFVCIILTSCQKDFPDSVIPVVPPVIQVNDSVTRLSKLIFIDTNTSAADTTGYYEFMYDSLKRVTAVASYTGNNGQPDEVNTYYYNGIDSIAYKKTGVDNTPGYAYSYTTLYVYDNLNRLLMDSSFSNIQVEVHHYTYSGTLTTMMGYVIDFSNPTDPFIEADTGLIGSTGDVIKINSGYDNENTISNFTYDNNQNPFYQLNIRSTYNPVPGNNFFLEDLNLQRNNPVLLTHESVLNPGTPSHTTYLYTYNALGFPDQVDVSYENAQVDNVRLIFAYKKI